MSTRYGPYRMVAIQCGKFDYAELELDAPIHLIGPNNVGKTSLIALLQFLYLDDQRHMKFAREMTETRRYYFPEKYSYALFECLTPTGFQVVGVRGLGPVRQYDFERFVYQGRIEVADFLDDARVVRDPEDTIDRLANKSFRKMEPRHLRAALTGVGDGHDVYLGLVPAKDRGAYDRFRTVFGNILRLAHVRQDELKQLLLDIYSPDLQQREINLARNYSAQLEQVRRDTHDVAELGRLRGDIERLLRHIDRREAARRLIPALWQALGRLHQMETARLQREEEHLQQERATAESEQQRIQAMLAGARTAQHGLIEQRALLDHKLTQLEAERERYRDFIPEWAGQRRADLAARLETLVVQLRALTDESVPQVERRLAEAERALPAKQMRLQHIADAAINALRRDWSDADLEQLFRLLNPEWLGVPVDTDAPGVTVTDEPRLQTVLRELLAGVSAAGWSGAGIRLDLGAVQGIRLQEYLDEAHVREQVDGLERDIVRYRFILEAARNAEALRREKIEVEREQAERTREWDGYVAFQEHLHMEPDWRKEQAALRTQWDELDQRIAAHEQELVALQQALRRAEARQVDLRSQRHRLQEQMRALFKPAGEWPLAPLAEEPADLDEAVARYGKAYAEERAQAEQVQELLETIDARTYGRHTGADEDTTVQALRDQLDSIPDRERAVEEMWKGIAVGIKKDLQSIGRDVEIMKSRVSGLNRQMGAVSISNLASLRLEIEERPTWSRWIREISVDDELPLFGDPKAADLAFDAIARLLAEHEQVKLQDLFDLCFEIGAPDGKVRRHAHLDTIESNGTTVAIKVLVNLLLLRGILGRDDIQIPFYLDECSSLDQGNLGGLVQVARRMGFIAVLASPDAMDAADKLYFIEENDKGRVVLDPRTALVRLSRPSHSPAPMAESPDA
jgi:hypothetical protein